MAMRCPVCGAFTKLKETRPLKKNEVTRRTYQCSGSHKTQEIHKFNTHERVVSVRIKSQVNKDD